MSLKNTWFNRAFRGNRMEAEEDIASRTSDIESGIEGVTRYEIPESITQNLEMLQTTAGDIRDMGQETVDIAKARTGVSEMPGEALARKQIEQSGARTTQNILQAGGGGAAALGALAQAGLSEQSAFGQLATQRSQYRSQAEQDLMGALRSQSSMASQAAQLESSGYQTMAQQQQQQFEYGREQELTGLQFNVDQLAGARAEETARRQRNSELASGILSTVGTIGGTLLGGPVGGAIGGSLGSASGSAIT